MEDAQAPLHIAPHALAKLTRWALGGLLAFGALNAAGGAIYGLSGAKGVPVEWLAGSPFHDYFVPSFVLLVVVGGSLITAAVAVLTSARHAHAATLAAGILLLAWIAAQVAIIGYVSWMQPTTAAAAVVVLVLAARLPRTPAGASATAREFVSRYACGGDRAGLRHLCRHGFHATKRRPHRGDQVRD